MLNSPVRRMPPEITAEIFLYLSAESSVLPSGLVSGLSSPLILGQICRNWRAIALSLSRLWSSFEARFPDRNNGRSDQRTRLMKTWLSRSHPLPVIFDYTPNRVEESPEAFQVFVKIIKSCASRWLSLSLEIPASATYSLGYYKVFHGISFPELEIWSSGLTQMI